MHLLGEGVYVYGAPSKHASGVGSVQWLNDLAGESGITVKEEETKPERYRCRQCGGRVKIHRESGSDAHLISDLLWLAWQDRYDVAIVVSGDSDLLPSVERIQLSGRKVVAALFDKTSLATRRTAHATVSLHDLLLRPDVYDSEDGPFSYYSALPYGLHGERLVRLLLTHPDQPGQIRESLMNDLESFLGDGWFTADHRSDTPHDEQKQAKLSEYRAKVDALLP